MTEAFINADMLTWARERAGFDVGDMAQKLGVKLDKLIKWESADVRPTFIQAQKFADKTFIPFGYLFFSERPIEEIPIPDLRTVGDHESGQFSLSLIDTIRHVMERQTWYADYLRAQGVKTTKVVGIGSIDLGFSKTVTDMKRAMSLEAWPSRGDWDDYMRSLVQSIEALGILVMKNSMVGANRYRMLDVDEFRGFAIADSIAPAIFVNTADAPGPRLFTLIHELAHIWIGESGVSDGDHENQRSTEKFCNAVAAEFLAPEDEFLKLWQAGVENWRDNLPKLVSHFHVSRWVIARRALELGLIESGQYWQFVRKIRADYNAEAKKDGGPSYYVLQTGRVSKRFARAVASEALNNKLALRDAYHLIGIKPDKLRNYARKDLGL